MQVTGINLALVKAENAIANNPGGCTLAKDGTVVRPPVGYAVGVRPDPFPSLADAFSDLRPGEYVGYWRDPETGLEYIDAVNIVGDRDEALMIARCYGQLSVYDFRAGECIYL